ncbi:MAG: GAF domain-containing protein [Rhizobacter sp.]
MKAQDRSDFALRCRALGARLAEGELALPEFRARICALLTERFAVSRASLWRFVGAGVDRRMHCVGIGTMDGRFEPGGAVLHANAFSGYFEQLVTRGVYSAPDVQADPLLTGLAPYFNTTGVRALLDTCFAINGLPFGVLCLEETRHTRQWTASEGAALRQAASALSLVVARLGPDFDFGVRHDA